MIQQYCTKRVSEIGIVKMRNFSPVFVIRKASFRDKAMNVRIPFKGSAKGVQNTDKGWSEVSGFIDLEEHVMNYRGDGIKQTI